MPVVATAAGAEGRKTTTEASTENKLADISTAVLLIMVGR
jgi:hypothetical protein